MVLFEGMPYPIAVVYLKVAGTKEPISLPFIEAMSMFTNVTFDHRASRTLTEQGDGTKYSIKGDTEKAKNKTYIVSKQELMKKLELDIYNNQFKITDMAIQPMDELITEEVKQLIGL